MMDLETYARDLANARKSAWSWREAAERKDGMLQEGREWIYRILMDAGWVDIPYKGLEDYLRKLKEELDNG